MSEFIDSFHRLTAFVIFQLTALLQLKYDHTQTLFSTHPITMFIAISSFMLYYINHVILLRSPISRFTTVAQLLLVWSAYVAASALATALFPAWATSSLYVILVLLSIGEIFRLFGNKFVIEDDDEDENEESETWQFRVYRRRLLKFCGNVAELFGYQPQPILPI